MICKNCQQDMPEESFELYPTGTRRRICRHCHYVLHMRKGRLKWVMRQRARALISLPEGTMGPGPSVPLDLF
ncbi:MAG: hypothetical protein IKN02_07860 [Prevotella sp.]|jgi:hypothetical protein|nr:hypothetical protein [Prevotella sp.]